MCSQKVARAKFSLELTDKSGYGLSAFLSLCFITPDFTLVIAEHC